MAIQYPISINEPPTYLLITPEWWRTNELGSSQGHVDQLVGSVRRKAGEQKGDTPLQVEDVAQHVKGKRENAMVKVKDVVTELTVKPGRDESQVTEPRHSHPASAASRWIRSLLKSLGPDIITGAADDDPSGIATYSVDGAQLGTKLLWTALLTWPLMAAVQMMCARIGKVTGQGLAANFKQRFPRWLLLFFVIALLVANTINIFYAATHGLALP